MGRPDSEDKATRLRIEVDAASAGERADKFLARMAPELSRARIQSLIADGRVSLGDATLSDASRRVKSGDVAIIDVPEAVAASPRAQAIPLTIVFEDAQLVVVDKPAGMVVHPAAGNPDGTLVNALLAHCGKSLSGIGGVGRPGIVHRIDKDTSGLIVAAKTEKAHRSLGKQFAAHAIERAYLAIVWGEPMKSEGTIEGALARSTADRKKMTLVKASGKHAVTHWRVVERFGRFAALLECRLETGRTHQIRVHLTHAGLPLIGDKTYGRPRTAAAARRLMPEKARAAIDAVERQALHAAVLGFQHPTTHKQMRFESPLPADLKALVTALRKV